MKNCPFCNTVLEDNESFCHGCGKSTAAPVTVSPETPAPVNVPAKSAKKSPLKIIIIIVLAIVLIFAGIVVYGLIRNEIRDRREGEPETIIFAAYTGSSSGSSGTSGTAGVTGTAGTSEAPAAPSAPTAPTTPEATKTVYLCTKEEVFEAGKVIKTTTVSYDANGFPVSMSISGIENGIDYTKQSTYTYDANGKLLNKTEKDDGPTEKLIKYTYDSNGRKTVASICDKKTETEYARITYAYDANGNMTEATQKYTTDSRSVESHTFTYDASGNCLSETVYSLGSEYRKFVYTYDANGNVQTKTMYEFGNEAWKGNFSYDANGNITELTGTDRSGNSYVEKYTYSTAQLSEAQAQKSEKAVDAFNSK